MTTRERVLATGVGLTLLLAGGTFLFHLFVYTPLQERDQNIREARKEVEAKQDQLNQAIADQPRLARLRKLSLPADIDLSRREYEKYLGDLMLKSGFEAGSFSVTPKPPDSR